MEKGIYETEILLRRCRVRYDIKTQIEYETISKLYEIEALAHIANELAKINSKVDNNENNNCG